MADQDEQKPRSKKEIEEDLRSIYTNRDGEIPDLTKLEYRKGSRLTRFLVRAILLLLVLAGLAWGGFFLWQPYANHTERPLTFAVEGPDSAVSGEEARYRVTYQNQGTIPIASLEVKLNLPAEFVLTDSTPTASDGTSFLIGSVSPGSDGEIDLTGYFRAAVPSTEKLQAFFTYRPANFNSDFQDIAAKTVAIQSSALTTAVTGPDKALPGDSVNYVATVTNNATQAVDAVRLRAHLPDSFALTASDPKSREDGIAEWDFPSLDPGASATVTLTGTYSSNATGTIQIDLETGLVDGQGMFVSQGTSSAQTDILGGNLAFHLIANGSSDNQTLNLGDTLRVSIDYANQGTDAIEGVSFTLVADTPNRSLPIDWTKADLSSGKQNGNQFVWDQSVNPLLAKMSPSDAGVIDLSLPLLPDVDPSKMSDDFTLKLIVGMTKVGSVESARTIETTPIEFKVNSDAHFTAEARYFDAGGEQMGSGPLPPTVDQTTTYRVFWNLANTVHDLNGATVTANLPPDVSWTANTHADVGTLTYNDTTRTVTWNMDSLPTSIGNAQGWFDLAITPKASDAGSFMKLTNATSFEAKDLFTSDLVHASVDVLDTELPNDKGAAGKGVVADATP